MVAAKQSSKLLPLTDHQRLYRPPWTAQEDLFIGTRRTDGNDIKSPSRMQTMTASSIRHLTQDELKCLEQFAIFEISLDQLRSCLRNVVKFNFDAEAHGGKRWMENNFIAPEPGVPITRWHLENALTKKRNGDITDEQLIEWATMLLMNHAYEFDQKDEDFIADWLNDISFDLRPFEE